VPLEAECAVESRLIAKRSTSVQNHTRAHSERVAIPVRLHHDVHADTH